MCDRLYYEVDCKHFSGQIFNPQSIFFQYICPESGHQANPGVVSLTGSIKNVFPNGGIINQSTAGLGHPQIRSFAATL